MKNPAVIFFIAIFASNPANAFYRQEIPNINAGEIAMMSAYENPDQVGKGYYINSELKHKLNSDQVRKPAKKPALKVK